jgi:cullin-associated NEDD8-dissociated protein 1
MKEDDDDEGWGGSDFSDNEGAPDDDDDTSWKVRRSAINIVDAIVKTRPDKVKDIIQRFADKLIDQIKERVDDVKVDVLNTF